jgi:hypothetical protein
MGGAFFGFCTGLMALGTVMLDGSTWAFSSSREPGSPAHWFWLSSLPPPYVTIASTSPVCASASTVVDSNLIPTGMVPRMPWPSSGRWLQ